MSRECNDKSVNVITGEIFAGEIDGEIYCGVRVQEMWAVRLSRGEALALAAHLVDLSEQTGKGQVEQ